MLVSCGRLDAKSMYVRGTWTVTHADGEDGDDDDDDDDDDVGPAQQNVLKLPAALDEVVGAHYSWP
jgi:hypothetical protein